MPIRRPSDPLVVALIIGNGWTHARANKTDVHFPSVVGIEQSAFTDIDMSGNLHSAPLTWDGVTFVSGEDAYKRSRVTTGAMGSDKVGSVTHRRLMISALYRLFGAQDIEPDVIVTTLPVLDYDSKGVRENTRERLAGDYIITANGREFCYSIRKDAIKVLPEGLPTVVDAIYNNNLRVVNEDLTQDTVGVINIGTYTTDLIMLERQQPLTAFCRSIPVGLSKVWEDISQKAHLRFGRELQPYEADLAVKRGYFDNGAQRVFEVAEWSEIVFEQQVEQIAVVVNELWNGGRAVRHIVVAGGGAIRMKPYIALRYEKLVVFRTYDTVEESASTEMNGAYKLAQIKLQKA